jgi:hypothetical protein
MPINKEMQEAEIPQNKEWRLGYNLIQIFWKFYSGMPIDFHQFVHTAKCRLRETCDQMGAYSKCIHLMSLHLQISPPQKQLRTVTCGPQKHLVGATKSTKE